MSRLLHSTIHQVMRYFWVLIANPFFLLWSIFFNEKYTNYLNTAFWTKNSNFKALPVFQMMNFNIITPISCNFLIKMRCQMTSYKKQFKKYQNFPQNIKISSIIHENDVITPIIWKKWISHKLHHNKNESMVKVAKKNICWKFAW